MSPLDHEIMGEKAAALGRAGERVELCLRRLRDCEGGSTERSRLLREAAQAVYAYFIQRELCGLRRHREVIREYAIPDEVLVRLGAS
ncbi:MAG: hypothetical protein JJ913_12635 [Rhizobiaceae bacterium]|nr:hypothetical protein [Rhizobiaceae bacterium]